MSARCTLCACEAVTEVYGFRVCTYHVAAGESSPGCPACTTPAERELELAAQVSYGALLEAGRPDLALIAAWFTDDDGSIYIEPLDELEGDDLALVERAERLALEAIARKALV